MLESILQGETESFIRDVIVRTSITLVAWLMITTACLVDLWAGISTAKALGVKPNSHGLRKTMTKVGDYFKVALVALMFDLLGSVFSWYQLPYMTLLTAVAVLLIEGKSVVENMSRKKSNAGKIPEYIEMIIEAKDKKEAGTALNAIAKWFYDMEKNGKWGEPAHDEHADGGQPDDSYS